MCRLIASQALAWCLLLSLTGCALLRPQPPAPRQSLPLKCAPQATERCEGIGILPPQSLSADAAAVFAELSLIALQACSVRHDELRDCVRRHNAKARK